MEEWLEGECTEHVGHLYTLKRAHKLPLTFSRFSMSLYSTWILAIKPALDPTNTTNNTMFIQAANLQDPCSITSPTARATSSTVHRDLTPTTNHHGVRQPNTQNNEKLN